MERTPMETAVSTDVVMDIVLSHLKVRDLLNCRKVSKFWNKAASLVLRKRSTMIKKILTTKALMELEKSIKQNSDFPFTGLQFDQPWALNSPRVKQFFEKCGEKFTNLYLRATRKTRIQDLAPYLNHLHRLSILEMIWPPQRAELLDSAAGQKGDRILNLPSLRTLRISSELNEGVLCQLLRAASSSKLQIEVLKATYGTLSALKNAGKLQAVPVLSVENIKRQEDYALQVDELLSTVSPMLTKLDFSVSGCISHEGLMKLLISSQYTLKYLRLYGICPSQFLAECPVLTKLTKLSLDIFNELQSYEYVFQGKQGHKFPALKELELRTTSTDDKEDPVFADISDGLFIVPSLTTIALDGFVDKAAIKDLARCFPNVVEIRLKHRYFSEDPTVIWSVGAFNFLEKLEIWGYPVRRPSKKYMNMDRFLTGIPKAICKNLRKHAQQNLIDSSFNEILRENPSILQLKNLKELIVCMKLEGELEELPGDPPFISTVSIWYALQMMPNLEARFVYDPPSLLRKFGEERRDKAVAALKAFFEHVQPYVELKPFFY